MNLDKIIIFLFCFVSCYLGSTSLWLKLAVKLHHKSLCQPVNQMLMIKMGEVNCWVASFG